MEIKENMQDLNLSKREIDLLFSRGFIKYPDYLKIINKGFCWPSWVSQKFLILGAALILAGIVCFFAFNWAEMGKFLKLSLPLAGFLALCAAAVFKGLDSLAGKICSLGAGVMIGVFLAVYGQVYQTGADAWQLFFSWALLMLPLAVLTRFTGMWLLFALIVNVLIILYPSYPGDRFENTCLALAAFNFIFVALSEFGANKMNSLKEPYFKGILYAGVVLALFIPAEAFAVSYGGRQYLLPFILFWLFNAAAPVYFVTRKKNITLIGLSAAAAATIFLTVIIRNIGFMDRDAYLPISFIAIALYGSAAFMVYKTYRYFQGGKNDKF